MEEFRRKNDSRRFEIPIKAEKRGNNFKILLFTAIKDGNRKLLETLLDKRAEEGMDDINQIRDKYNNTLLHWAAEAGQLEIFILLLTKYGADIAARNIDGDTVLHSAAEAGQLKIVEFLYKNGVNLLVENNKGATAMHYAARNGKTKVLEFLHALGISLVVEDQDFETPLHYAAKYGSVPAIKWLHDNDPEAKNKVDRDTYTPTHFAAKYGSVEAMRTFLDYCKTDIDQKTEEDRVGLLHCAAWGGKKKNVKELIYLGAEINEKNDNGETAVHYAAEYGNLEVIKELAKNGGNIRAKNNEGEEPIHYAAEEGEEAILDWLIESGVDKNARTETNETPLIYAAKNKRMGAIKILVSAGADANIPDMYGRRAEDYYPMVRVVCQEAQLRQMEDAEKDFDPQQQQRSRS